MLPLPPVRTLNTPNRFRKAIKAVDDYTLWAFNPPAHLVRGAQGRPVRRTSRT